MSKQTNLTSLRIKSFNLCNFQKSNFVEQFQLLEHLKQLFLKKNVVVSKEYLNVSPNYTFFTANLFFKTKQLKFYKQFSIKQKKLSDGFHSSTLENLNQNNFLKNKNVVFHFYILNNFLNKSFLIFFFNKLKGFSSVLFPRRFGLFIDFIKLSCLFFYSHLSLCSYSKLIADVFKFLRKKSHSKFFSFLKTVFDLFLSSSLREKFPVSGQSINGIKLTINGRLKGKAMASKTTIRTGLLPSQTIHANVHYSATTAFTPNYGVFGFKLWYYKI